MIAVVLPSFDLCLFLVMHVCFARKNKTNYHISHLFYKRSKFKTLHNESGPSEVCIETGLALGNVTTWNHSQNISYILHFSVTKVEFHYPVVANRYAVYGTFCLLSFLGKTFMAHCCLHSPTSAVC